MVTGNGISIRDQSLPVASGASIFDVLRKLGVSSFEALVDFNLFLPYLQVPDGMAFSLRDAEGIRQLRQRLTSEKMPISALLIATDFSADDAVKHIDWAVQVIAAAAELRVPVVRIDTWTSKASLFGANVLSNLIAGVREVLDKTGDSGVDLGLENHGQFSNDEQFLDDIFRAIQDPRLGLTLDTGNFYWWGYPRSDVYRLIEKYAPLARHTHLKNINYPPDIADLRRAVGHQYKECCSPLFDGSLDMKRVIELLLKGGYRRDLCIEDESLFKVPEEQRLEVLCRDVETVRQALTRSDSLPL